MAEEFLKHVQSRNFVVKVKLDSSGRKGKTVTVLDGFPKVEPFLVELVRSLKKSCGVGGTYLMNGKDGVIELQGDQRERVLTFLDKYEMKHKP
jgi:translation initiation factor 1